MKRLGLYAIVSIMLVVGFGGFSSPQKSFAILTADQVAQINTIERQCAGAQPGSTLGGQCAAYTTAKQTYEACLAEPGHTTNDGGVDNTAAADCADTRLAAFNAQQTVTNTTGQNAAMGLQPATPKATSDKCTLASWSITDCIGSAFTWIIKNTFLEIAGFLVWLSANMLNLSIQIGILGFAQWAPDALYPIWIIVRQIVSLFIVFAGLWLGFMYIIGRDEKFRQYIPWVIIFALFVNFSYPLSRALIDVSNVVSLNVYTSAVGSEPLIGNNPVGQGAGALIMNRLGLQGLIMSATSVESKNGNFLGQINSVPGALMAVAFVLYAAYIFFMATAIIAVRTAVLVFLIIASPILFVDSVIPKLGDEAAKLRKIYFEQLVVAPVFMIMLALTLKFLEVFQKGPMSTVNIQSGSLVSGNSSSVVTFFNILMMLIMLHIMLKVTKSVSGSVGQAATNFMGKAGGFGLGVATGGAGLLARNTLGSAAASLRDSKWVTNNQDSFLGRRAYNMTNSLANSTYDARNTDLIGGRMAKAGMGMGAGAKLGYEKEREARDKDIAERYSRTGTFRKNVFNKDGTIANKKGDIDTSNTAAKERFYNKSGGVILGRDDLRAKLDLSRKSIRSDAVSEYSKLEDNEKREFFEKQDEETKQKLLAYDAKLAKGDNKEFNKDQERKETLEVNKSMAESQKDLANAMRGEKEEKKTEPLPVGYEATPSGILIPTQKSSALPKENEAFDINTHSFADRVAGKTSSDKKAEIDLSKVKLKL